MAAGEREREQELCGEQLDCALEGGGVERNDFDKGNHVSVPSSSERGRERERERESGSESENGAGNKRDSSREGNTSARDIESLAAALREVCGQHKLY